jgi:hypothetical protein
MLARKRIDSTNLTQDMPLQDLSQRATSKRAAPSGSRRGSGLLFSLGLGLVFALTTATADVSGQEALPTQQQTPAAKPVTQTVTRSSNISAQDQERIMAEVREIMAIRQQMGGGVAEQLRDVQLDLNPVESTDPQANKSKPAKTILSEKFAQELKQQAILRAKQPVVPAATANEAAASEAAANTTPVKSAIQPLTSAPELIQPPKAGTLSIGPMAQQPPSSTQPAKQPLDGVQVMHLRKSAKMLEEAAANLEMARQYDQADKIRALAGEIWRSAR